MKTLIFLLISTVLVTAATITIDIPTNDIPRVSEAFGYIYQLGGPANVNQVTYYTRWWIIGQTTGYEAGKYNRQYVQPPLDMQPTPTPTATATATPTPTPTPTP